MVTGFWPNYLIRQGKRTLWNRIGMSALQT